MAMARSLWSCRREVGLTLGSGPCELSRRQPHLDDAHRVARAQRADEGQPHGGAFKVDPAGRQPEASGLENKAGRAPEPVPMATAAAAAARPSRRPFPT